MDLGYIWQRIKWSPVPFHCFVHLPKIDTCNHGRVPFSVLSLGFQQPTNTPETEPGRRGEAAGGGRAGRVPAQDRGHASL